MEVKYSLTTVSFEHKRQFYIVDLRLVTCIGSYRDLTPWVMLGSDKIPITQTSFSELKDAWATAKNTQSFPRSEKL